MHVRKLAVFVGKTALTFHVFIFHLNLLHEIFPSVLISSSSNFKYLTRLQNSLFFFFLSEVNEE